MMDQIIGQDRAVEMLQRWLLSGRLHHAYIFHGPVGVGKFTTAVAFAKLLLCHQPQRGPQGLAACGGCASCGLMRDRTRDDGEGSAGAHPDLHLVTKELARHSDDAAVRARKLTSIPLSVLRRHLVEPVYRRTQLGTRKALIVDEAHLLNDAGQNLLLKTLEEPPPETFLILVTASEDKLLATIRSRCQRLAFVGLSAEAVGQWLDRQVFELTAAQRTWLVGFADGSLGRAGLAVEYGLERWAQTILPAVDQMVHGRLSADLGQQIAEMIDELAKRWVQQRVGASKEAANKEAAGLLWAIIAQHARGQIARLSADCDPHAPEVSESLLEPWLGVIDALEQSQLHMDSHVNMGLVTDHLVSRVYRSLSGRPAAWAPMGAV